MTTTSDRKPSTCCSAAGGRSSGSPPNLGSAQTRCAPGGIRLSARGAQQRPPERSAPGRCGGGDPPPATRGRIPAPPARHLKKSHEHTLRGTAERYALTNWLIAAAQNLRLLVRSLATQRPAPKTKGRDNAAKGLTAAFCSIIRAVQRHCTPWAAFMTLRGVS